MFDTEGAEVLILKGVIKKTIPIVNKILIETHSIHLKKQCEEILTKEGLKFVFESIQESVIRENVI